MAVRFNDLKGRPIIALNDANKLGSVDDLLLNIQTQAVAGLQVHASGIFSGHKDLSFEDIQSIGDNAVTVHSADALKDSGDVPGLGNLPHSDYILRSKVMAENGNDVGTVKDIDFDPKSGQIHGYVLSEGLLSRIHGEVHIVPSSSVQSLSKNMLVVENDVVERAQLRT